MFSSQANQKMQAADTTESLTGRKNSITANSNRTSPPEYDTLSLAPPSISDQHQTPAGDHAHKGSISKLKQKYKALKEENTQRKAERVKYASTEEIDRMTACTEENNKRRSEGKNVGGLINGKNFVGKSMGTERTSMNEIDAGCPRHVYTVGGCRSESEAPTLY